MKQYKWKDHHGHHSTLTLHDELHTSREDMDSVARQFGWPGHDGSLWARIKHWLKQG